MKKYRLILIRGAVFVVLFLISLTVISRILNRGNTDLTADMPSASLPIVYMNIDNLKVNALHGYTMQMEGNFLRGPITPINADRSLDVEINTFGTSIAKLLYEVRSLDCKRLIENGDLESFDFKNDIIRAKFTFKDLIEDEKEYMLVIKLTNGDGNVIDYYARIINTTELSLVDKINFCTYFSETTFDQGKAPELKKYMESNAYGDNSSYGYVNIHSSYNQLSWGTLAPIVMGEKNINIISIDSLNACIELLYRVRIKNELYNVKEYFRIRKGTERMYLMEYERTMNQIINNESNAVVNNKIINGIVNEPVKVSESPNDSIVAFVQENSLFSFNTGSGNIARVFSFRDEKNDDERVNYNASDIKVMSIDEAGNVTFLVYGYMNRGFHEGQVGVALYYYDAVVNTIEEQLFIPYRKSYEILKKDIEKLSYINTRGKMYVLLDSSVYSINLESKETETVAKNLDETRFVSSNDNSIIAWQTGNGIADLNSLQFYSLNKITPEVMNAPAGNIIMPLGFIGNDLVYGTALISDITTDTVGRTIIPMRKITIEDIKGNILKEYEKENVYISGVEINDEMIVLERLSKDEEEKYYDIDPDQILTSDIESANDNIYTSVVTDEMETTHQIVLAKEGNYDSVKVLTPKEVLYEEDRNIEFTDRDNKSRYFVYAKGEMEDVYTDASAAVVRAEELFGVVVNKDMDYIWESGNRKSKTRIETFSDTTPLTEEQIMAGITPVVVCLESMLEYKEVYKDVDTLLRGQETVLSVLNENIDGEVLDLAGCSLDSVLYYVNRGYPVMAIGNGSDAEIIVGYDSKNTILYNPLSGEVFKKGINDSTAYFNSLGNKYVTYVD
ncbi:MAG: hypothetical protein Q4E51_00440 [Lachnospiraceae bacterium]|nr:hypothetical protein [Lachnospiraceae bacterium]